MVTTTGFVTADFTMWSFFATGIFFALFFVGGSAGSTSGGIKIVRHIVMLKNSFLELNLHNYKTYGILTHIRQLLPVSMAKQAWRIWP